MEEAGDAGEAAQASGFGQQVFPADVASWQRTYVSQLVVAGKAGVASMTARTMPASCSASAAQPAVIRVLW
jgi:hypothetical protein